jgi:hypothetical protein
LADANGHQHRDVTHLIRPAALEHDAIKVDVRILALNRPVPPGLNLLVNLLGKVTDCARGHPDAP